ncbi:hypothetical protein PMAYCL1PPCAC_21547, partial [Pristionchus mayeri]
LHPHDIDVVKGGSQLDQALSHEWKSRVVTDEFEKKHGDTHSVKSVDDRHQHVKIAVSSGRVAVLHPLLSRVSPDVADVRLSEARNPQVEHLNLPEVAQQHLVRLLHHFVRRE